MRVIRHTHIGLMHIYGNGGICAQWLSPSVAPIMRAAAYLLQFYWPQWKHNAEVSAAWDDHRWWRARVKNWIWKPTNPLPLLSLYHFNLFHSLCERKILARMGRAGGIRVCASSHIKPRVKGWLLLCVGFIIYVFVRAAVDQWIIYSR